MLFPVACWMLALVSAKHSGLSTSGLSADLTGLSAETGLNEHTKSSAPIDCMPVPAQAPYGLPLRDYGRVHDAVQSTVDTLLSAGCTVDVLAALASCVLAPPEDTRAILGSVEQECRASIELAVGKSYRYMLLHGCMRKGDLSPGLQIHELIFYLKDKAAGLPSKTTCSGVVKTAARSFEDAIKSILIHPPPPDLSGLSSDAETKMSNVTEGIRKKPDADEGARKAQLEEELRKLEKADELPPAQEQKPDQDQDQDHKQIVTSPASSGPNLWVALLAGALAGLAVDLSLFPLDTIKTRLQSAGGFAASGGLRGLYQGIGSIALGSAPSSALFFLAYEFAGRILTRHMGETFVEHMLATTIGEVASSLIRVPADVVKSRQQVETSIGGGSMQKTSLRTAIARVYEEGSRPNARSPFGAFYTGWLSTLVREIPFGCIQFPLFSALKTATHARYYADGEPLGMAATAVCGMLAGSVAGSLTTPLDVVKTRIMLSERGENVDGIPAVLMLILRTEGVGGLFKGLVPRTLWIAIGGAIFLGGYDGFTRLIADMAR